MSSAAYARVVSGIGVLFCVVLALILTLQPDAVETRAHSLIVARVNTALAQQTQLAPSPQRRADVQRVLADACRSCSPRRPLFLPREASFEAQIALRFYIGATLDLFIGAWAFLGVNLASSLLCFAWAHSRPASATCPAALATLTVFSELAASVVAPTTFERLLLTSEPLRAAEVWCLALSVLGAACFTAHGRRR